MKTRIIAKLLESDNPSDNLIGLTYLLKKYRSYLIANIFLRKYRIHVDFNGLYWSWACYKTKKFKEMDIHGGNYGNYDMEGYL